jgi:large subunit ribosomal protein L3
MPGSIGSGGMQRVFKGLRMGGRMGGEQVTVKNLEVVEIDVAKGIIAVKGAVPGAYSTDLVITGGYEKKTSWS